MAEETLNVPDLDAAHATAGEFGLGRLVSYWVGRDKEAPSGQQTFAVIGLGTSLLAIVLLFALVGHSGSAILCVLILAFAALGFAWMLVHSRGRLSSGCEDRYLFERGLVEGVGGDLRAVPFSGHDLKSEVVNHLSHNSLVARNVRMSLHDSEGAVWKYHSALPEAAELARELGARHAEVRAEELLAEVRSGREVEFKTVTLGPAGISSKKAKNVPYESLTRWISNDGMWQVQWATTPGAPFGKVSGSFAETPNVRAMITLLFHLSPELTDGGLR